MRRGFAAVGATLVVLLVAACGNQSRHTNGSKGGQTSTSKPTQTSSTASGQGFLNAFSGNAAPSQQAKAALKSVRDNPNNRAAWAVMVQALWTTATSGGNYNASRGSFTASGKNELSLTTQAWQHYLALSKHPDPNLAVLAARAYAALGNYAGAASAWEVETASSPHQARGFECLAVSAYAAKQTRKGDLALSRVLSLAPKAQRAMLKREIQLAGTQPTIAQQC